MTAGPAPSLRVGERLLEIIEKTELPGRVSTVHLQPIDGTPLRSFAPGSNLGLRWSEDTVNSYSLIGETTDPADYRISVLAQPQGRGGSLWIHSLDVGDVVVSTGVRSAFAPIPHARHHLLVAAGIGITPILSHARWHRRWGHSFEVAYVHRPGEGVHLDELRELCGDHLHEFESRTAFWPAFTAMLSAQPFGSHLYTCGPLAMIDAVADAATAAHWPGVRVHAEAFSAQALEPGRPFRAVLTRSKRTVDVPSGASLLESVEKTGIRVPNLCRQGLCGECRVVVSAGAVEHRDLVLSDAEKAAGRTMMACVSRAVSDTVEVEL